MSAPSSPMSMDAKTKFQQLWAQFGTAFMEEPMLRDHSKRVEDLVRENERLRVEISATKAEQKQQSSEAKLTAEELETLREEVNQEVKSGMERVQERNAALARKDKEVLTLRRELQGMEAVWAQERAKYKQTIRLLRDELESAVVAHERLRKNVGVLTGELEEEFDEDEYDEEEEIANQAELQLQSAANNISGVQSGASYRRASRRLQVEETPAVEDGNEDTRIADDEDDDEDYEYYEAPNGEVYEEGDVEEQAEEGGDEDEETENHEDISLQVDHDEDAEPEDDEEDAEDAEAEEAPEPEQTLRRSTRNRKSDAAENPPSQTLELVGAKRGRDESSDLATVDGAAQIPDRQTEYNGTASAQDTQTETSDPAERPAKRTRRQTERYTTALESTKNFGKIMTPPATSPPFLPSVLPRRRSPSRKSTTLSQTSTPAGRRGPKRRGSSAAEKAPGSAPPKAGKVTQPAGKSPGKPPAKTGPKPSLEVLSPEPTSKALKQGRKTKRSVQKSTTAENEKTANQKENSAYAAYPKSKFEFTLVSGFKHNRNLIVDDAAIKEAMEPLLARTTERIRSVAVTPGFWRSYAHKRNIQRKEAGLSQHCAFTSQFPVDSDQVETENQWEDGEEYACKNCLKENIVCFTVGQRLDTEKYGAVYKPPKRD